ncbi:hypothetical protein GOZ97_07340 [Agrobacterium vitis]|uniref:hypothetical protein n=2 Tax=Agrobacterium vitis TaxID=373 RepID=UPI0008FB21C9|nr:hypothetical protein [Agrobacterium vitis]MUZ53012.1 hypothetical protein [Agrobacterium vitis]MUZ91231.1 hypothetical protein [Agrobacterium vitis]MVA40325.1 hypothetical protein [Agrobacterium vitis]NSX96171.1 hypothetical protein [Agrobacterium vitis]NSZ27310.1 hypothetical protein [Agrobacterium vitis]
MVWKALMMVPLALILMSAKGCQTLEQRASAAAVVQGQARVQTPFPDLPEACVAKMGRVVPRGDEARVVTLKRWEVVADNRDRQAADCAAWGVDMKSNFGAR